VTMSKIAEEAGIGRATLYKYFSDLEGILVAWRGEHVARARQQLQGFIRDLLLEGARAGKFRDDVAADELASYTLHALSAASSLTSKKAAVRRLVQVTLTGLRAPR
jgi:AcrR family transcriptional regulator